jgi:transposase
MLKKESEKIVPNTKVNSIGVDDFAYSKGHTYCTIICDSETRKPIEVLGGRDGETLKEWLEKNKQVKRVTRDRAGAYAKAISDVLPQAMQIADRFHLHQNLLTAVKDALKNILPNEIEVPNIDSCVLVEDYESSIAINVCESEKQALYKKNKAR